MKDYGKYLIAPQHHGWSRDNETGQVKFLEDDRWKAAFPDCKFNELLGTNPSEAQSLDSGTQRRIAEVIDRRRRD